MAPARILSILRGHAGEVGIDYVAIDVDDRRDVVVGDGAGFSQRCNCRHVAENLHRLTAHGHAGRCRYDAVRRSGGRKCRSAAVGRSERNVVDVLQVVEQILRRLHGDRVADAVARVEPEVRSGLEAAAGSCEQAACNIGLPQSQLAGPGAVHIHHQFRIVEGLLDAQVGGAGYMLDLVQQLFGNGPVAVHISADDLDIDGSRQAEVEDLRDHVDGQRVEGDAGEAVVQDIAQLLHVGVGGAMLLGELHRDVGIGGTDGSGVGVRGIQTAVGKSDVVDDGVDFVLGDGLANGVVDLIAEIGDIFNTRAGVGAEVNLELAAVDGGKEVLTEIRIEKRG